MIRSASACAASGIAHHAPDHSARISSKGDSMHYRLLTVNREFGSGGGRIAQTIAQNLGWKLLDRDIIDAIAYEAHVDIK